MSADSGRVLADSHVVHAGRKLATAEGRLYAEDGGKLFAHATTSCSDPLRSPRTVSARAGNECQCLTNNSARTLP